MSLSKDLIFLILQFCDEENLKRTACMLEQESGYFFNLKCFEDLLLDGNWEEAEKYLSSFTFVEDNKFSTKIYFEIRKQKFLEVLDKREHAVALDILLKELKVFAESNKELYIEMTQLLSLDDFREHISLTFYTDALSARKRMVREIRTVIEANPLLQGKTKFPQIDKSRLRRLINQSLNWQHIHCVHPHPQPHIDTLFTDHRCPGPDNILDPLNKKNSLHPEPILESDQSSVTDSANYSKALNPGMLSNQGDTHNIHDTSDSKAIKTPGEVGSPSDLSSRHQEPGSDLPDEFPCTVEKILNVVSSPSSMDFHPVDQTLLLVGKSAGDIELWDVASAQQLFKRQFVVWEEKSVSEVFLEDIRKNPGISVKRILWSPDGSLFGVAYSKCVVHLFKFRRNDNCYGKHLEIDAHVGSVNDLAFTKPHSGLVVISCGDDKLIQVWDAVTGAKKFTFEGHEAPVYSLYPHVKENIHFLFSISTSGEIKAWLFDNMGSRVTYYAPGFCSTRMAYSTDGKRLFSCGTNKDGESYIVEWDEREGCIIRIYHGLSKCCSSVVQFDTSSSRFLAAGDDHLIKIWEMDNAEILGVFDANGGLPAKPYVCFNKNGTILAVSADCNQIKILANDHGRELLRTSATVSGDSLICATESVRKLTVDPISVPLNAGTQGRHVSPEGTRDALRNIKPKSPVIPYKMEKGSISKVVGVSRCQSLLLPSEVKTNQIRRLIYTNAGNGILALAEDGIHLLWKWLKSSDTNLTGGEVVQATTKCVPQLWQPKSGLLMINDLPENNSGVVVPCFCLSRNDSYLISSSGRMITLYNTLIFKKIRNAMASPPAATCIVFYPPDNNIIAVGMDDSTILIYNIRVDEMISKLEGHSKRISGLAFSTTWNVLVSAGVDTQVVQWDSVTWEKKKSTVLQISIGWLAADSSETNIELDKDQKHFLAVHETQLAIYETNTLRRLKQWAIGNFCTRISHAKFSCDSQWIYAVMRNGILLILSASDLAPRFEIDPSAYLPPHLSSNSSKNDGVYHNHEDDPMAVVVAAHPKKPNQCALGLSNGGVVVIEPEPPTMTLPPHYKEDSQN